MEIYLPKEDIFAAIFSNCDCYYPKDIALKLATVTAGRPYKCKEIFSEDMVLEGYTGVYENEVATKFGIKRINQFLIQTE